MDCHTTHKLINPRSVTNVANNVLDNVVSVSATSSNQMVVHMKTNDDSCPDSETAETSSKTKSTNNEYDQGGKQYSTDEIQDANSSCNSLAGAGDGDDRKRNNDGQNGDDSHDNFDDATEEQELEDEEKNTQPKTNSLLDAEAPEFRPDRLLINKQNSIQPGSILISHRLTTVIIPDLIMENIQNVYWFMNKSLGFRGNTFVNENDIAIINFGFTCKHTNETLYCVAEPHSGKNRHQKWKMIDDLFTKTEIRNSYKILEEQLPKSVSSDERLLTVHNITQFQDALTNEVAKYNDTKNIFNVTKWNKIPIINRKSNKKRLTLSITKTEFKKRLKEFCISNNFNKLVPILVFGKNTAYHIEYIWIVTIDRNDIGISMKYVSNGDKSGLKVTGIHLDKQFIINQHQLVAPWRSVPDHSHTCSCLDDFKSNINDLAIGNVDDQKNINRHLKKQCTELKLQIEVLKQTSSTQIQAQLEPITKTPDDIECQFYKTKLYECKELIAELAKNANEELKVKTYHLLDHLDDNTTSGDLRSNHDVMDEKTEDLTEIQESNNVNEINSDASYECYTSTKQIHTSSVYSANIGESNSNLTIPFVGHISQQFASIINYGSTLSISLSPTTMIPFINGLPITMVVPFMQAYTSLIYPRLMSVYHIIPIAGYHIQSPISTSPISIPSSLPSSFDIKLLTKKSKIFIPKTITMKSRKEFTVTFRDHHMYYYYLTHTIHLQLNNGFAKIFGHLMIIKVDLFDKTSGNELYAIIHRNKDTSSNQKYEWMLTKLSDAATIFDQHNISVNELPGSFRNNLQSCFNQSILNTDRMLPIISNNMKLKFLHTVKNKSRKRDEFKSEVSLSVNELKQCIVTAINQKSMFIPILRFKEKENKHWIEYVLICETPQKYERFNFGLSFNADNNTMQPTAIFLDALAIERQNMLSGKVVKCKELRCFKSGLGNITIFEDRKYKQ